MGGTGSGTWYRGNKQDTTEDCKSIDIRMMKRRGWLKPGHGGKLSWKWNGAPWGNINYRYYEDRLILNYRYRSGSSDWTPVTQTVTITTTPCHYGNARQWFLCPHCSYRCALLYGASRLFLCRKCYELPYTSQTQSELDRLIDQKHKIGSRIFEDYEYGEGWRKKRGLHWSTFERNRRKYLQLESRVNQGLCNRFGDELSRLFSN